MRRKTLTLLALAAAIIGGVWWWTHGPPDPVYQGQRLSEWTYQIEASEPPHELTREDLQAMGPDAVKWLTFAVEHGQNPPPDWASEPQYSAGRERLRELARKWLHLRLDKYYDERTAAARVLQILGPDALPAVPALLRATNSADESRYGATLDAIDAAGTAAFPMLLQALADGPQLARLHVANFLPCRLSEHDRVVTDTEYDELLNALLKACLDPDPDVRLAAANSIGDCNQLRGFNPIMRPAITPLVAFLSDADPHRRAEAADSLSRFCNEATVAIPRLVELLTDADDEVSGAAACAIHQIDWTDRRVVPRFRRMLGDPQPNLRTNAEHYLKKLDELPRE